MRTLSIIPKNQLNFLICGQLVSRENFIHMKRTLSENVLIIVKEGSLFINSNNVSHEISKNQYILLKAGEEHFGFKESKDKLEYLWIHFSAEISEEPKQNFNESSFPEVGTINNLSRLSLLFRQMMDYSLDKDFDNQEILNHIFFVFMIEFLRSANSKKNLSKNSKQALVNDVCNWINYNFQQDFTLDELSNHFTIQSNYLSKIFKETLNQSIVQYTTEIRLRAAKNLLPNFSVKETAYSCGFSDEKYFMKVFKKIEGITPTEFKQAFSLRNINQ